MQSSVVLLWGELDDEVPVSVAEMTAGVIDQADGDVDLRVLEGVGHHVPIEAPKELRKAIDSVME